MRRRNVPVKQIELIAVAVGLAVFTGVVGLFALAGFGMGIGALSRDTSSGSVDLPSNLALLADPSAVTTGLVVQDGAVLTIVPIVVDNTTFEFTVQSTGSGAALAINGTNKVRGLRANGTLDLSFAVVGDDVLLTGNLPADVAKLCGGSCTGNDVLVVAPNGTCLQCSTGVRAASFMRTCGTCPPFASVRLAANSSCYECLSISPNNILVGGGDVHAAARANDTFVYSTMPQMMVDMTATTIGLTSYTYLSGSYKVTTFPTDYPGNTYNHTTYQIDIGVNTMVSSPAGNATTQVYIQFDFTSLVPGWVATPLDPDKSVVTGSVICASIPNPTGAWLIFFFVDNRQPLASLNSEYELINALCYFQYSVFWING